ncbi:MAG: ABC transporter permease [Pseudomonadota bacterium]
MADRDVRPTAKSSPIDVTLLLLDLAVTHVVARGRQTLLAILGVALGVGFSVAMAALLEGSQKDFVEQLINAIPNVEITDERREAAQQPAQLVFDDAQFNSLTTREDPRGIRNPIAVTGAIRANVEGRVSAALQVQGVIRYAGRDTGVSLSGVVPEDEISVSQIGDDMEAGLLTDLNSRADAVVLGDDLAESINAEVGDTVTLVSPAGDIYRYRLVGIFDSGNVAADAGTGYLLLSTAQVFAGRPNAVNTVRVSLDDPDTAPQVASWIESQFGYKSVSWQEANEALLESFIVRDIIMYTVVAAILLVAGFGIYNIISTITYEKTRDIAIMKSLGFYEGDMRRLFVMEGLAMGIAGSLVGAALGVLLTIALGQVEFVNPQSDDPITIPVIFSPLHYSIAIGIALGSAVFAAYMPARKASVLNPVDIIRGAT